MKSVMIIDDSIEHRLVLKLCLCDEYCIVEAGSGQEAATIYENEAIDFIISDLQMLNGDGFWFLNYLKEKNTVIPPVIIISGKLNIKPSDILSAGAIAFFSKPFDIEKLRELMRIVLISRRHQL